MAFFLLGRVDDTLNLLCPDVFATRQDALAALSRVTAKPEFDLWDAEVLLLDTDSGTPVLLVRPNADASATFVEPEAVEELEVIVVDELEEEPVIVGDAAISDAIVEEFEAAEEPDAATALKDALTRTAAQMESEGIVAPESIGAATADVEADADAEPESESAIEPESESAIEPEPESAIEPEPESAIEAEPEPATEAEPEPATEAEPETAAESADTGWPWDVAADTAAPELAVSPEIAFVLSDLEEPSLDDGSILRGSIDDESFAAAKPVIMGSYAEPSAAVVEPDLDVVAEPMGVTDVVPAAPAAPSGFAVPVVGDAADIFPLEPIAPEVSDEAAEETTEEALEVPVEEAADVAPVADTEPGDEAEATPGSAAEDAAIVESASDETDATDLDSNISDFIFDLEPIPAPVPVAENAAPVAEDAAPAAHQEVVDEYTCDDCIYEDTCPNRDQRLPKDCGSFSWR